MSELVILPEASDELRAAARRYAQFSERAAIRFEAGVDVALSEIMAAPESWPRIDEHYRFRLVKRFPYLVIYRISDSKVVVVAVAHSSRQEGYWRLRWSKRM